MNLPLRLVMFALSGLSLTSGWSDQPAAPAPLPAGEAKAGPAAAPRTLAQARGQAEALHEAMHTTLQIVHHQYYREDQGLPIPAEILKGVFAELEQQQGITLRWLVVQGQAMNADHKPQNRFEHDAVKALKAGEQAYERVERGVYRRAGSITLVNHCLKCHLPNRSSNEDRTAGLLISLPIQAD